MNPFLYLNMKRIELRRLKPKDRERIFEIESSSFPADGYSQKRIFRLCKINPDNFILAVCRKEPVGYLLTRPREKSMNIDSIAVDKTYRGLGIGGKMMRLAIKKSRIMKMKRVFLEVKINNKKAINFYKRLGFRNVRIIKKYYKDGNSAQKMVLNLK